MLHHPGNDALWAVFPLFSSICTSLQQNKFLELTLAFLLPHFPGTEVSCYRPQLNGVEEGLASSSLIRCSLVLCTTIPLKDAQKTDRNSTRSAPFWASLGILYPKWHQGTRSRKALRICSVLSLSEETSIFFCVISASKWGTTLKIEYLPELHVDIRVTHCTQPSF